ncbi:MAG: zf-HC2 domain-containing protein [Deltaproteobacteria bacterium]|nr:zf-HC2 domain-containing protein [Deltaproteobacteria bacterium]
MTPASSPDRDTLLMMLSAYLDGELSAAEEVVVQEALERDPELLLAFEALSRARLPGAALGGDAAAALTASILAATSGEVPATAAGVQQLASLAMDGALDEAHTRQLDRTLAEHPTLAPLAEGLVATTEAVQVAARAVGEAAAAKGLLQPVPERVERAVAAADRAGALVSGALDGALSADEAAELAAALPGAVELVAPLAAARHAGEALAAAAQSPVFQKAAQRAGEAALHVLAAEAARAAPAAPSTPRAVEHPGLLARLRRVLGGLTVPLGFAASAAALFFVLREPGSASSDLAAREAAKKALFDALAPTVVADSVDLAAADLPLLADNSADVEAIDATGTTMVFATEQSNITVIWIADDGDSQGT